MSYLPANVSSYIILSIIFFINESLFSQTTLIPDTNFEQALINLSIDSDGTLNGQVFTADIANVQMLDVSMQNIIDLTGIEGFTDLEELDCSFNQINIFNISNNIKLFRLNCEQNNISDLDVSNNTLLEYLDCGNPEFDVAPRNSFRTLDLTNNPRLISVNTGYNVDLTDLDVSENQFLDSLVAPFCGLFEIDVSNNLRLRYLQLGTPNTFLNTPSNRLTSVDVSQNNILVFLSVDKTDITFLNLKNGNNDELVLVFTRLNPRLTCIQVDDENAANNNQFPYNNWEVNPESSFSEDCSLAIQDIEEDKFIIYPNPVASNLFLKVSNEIRIKRAVILDFSGREILRKENVDSEINVENLIRGMYILKLDTDRGIFIKKILKL